MNTAIVILTGLLTSILFSGLAIGLVLVAIAAGSIATGYSLWRLWHSMRK